MPPNVLALSSRKWRFVTFTVCSATCQFSPKPLPAEMSKRRMAGQMIRAVAIKQAGAIADVCGNIAARRQVDRKAGTQRVSLIMIEEKQILRWREVSQSTGDRTLSLRKLVRVGEIELTFLEELRRPRRHLERSNPRSFNGQRKKDVRVAERVVIEEVLRRSVEVVGGDSPTLDRNSRAELILFVTLAAQGNEIDTLGQRKLRVRDQRESRAAEPDRGVRRIRAG